MSERKEPTAADELIPASRLQQPASTEGPEFTLPEELRSSETRDASESAVSRAAW